MADTPPTAALSIRITGLRSSNGQVGCTLYNSANGFPTNPLASLQARWCPIVKDTSVCGFAPIPAGVYAAACFHDENGNGKVDKGFLGIPIEGIVVSNHAKGFMGPPSFDKAKFSFAGLPAEIALRMAY